MRVCPRASNASTSHRIASHNIASYIHRNAERHTQSRCTRNCLPAYVGHEIYFYYTSMERRTLPNNPSNRPPITKCRPCVRTFSRARTCNVMRARAEPPPTPRQTDSDTKSSVEKEHPRTTAPHPSHSTRRVAVIARKLARPRSVFCSRSPFCPVLFCSVLCVFSFNFRCSSAILCPISL